MKTALKLIAAAAFGALAYTLLSPRARESKLPEDQWQDPPLPDSEFGGGMYGVESMYASPEGAQDIIMRAFPPQPPEPEPTQGWIRSCLGYRRINLDWLRDGSGASIAADRKKTSGDDGLDWLRDGSEASIDE